VGTENWRLGAAVAVHTIGVVVMIASDCRTLFLLKYRPGNLITDGMNSYIRNLAYLGVSAAIV